MKYSIRNLKLFVLILAAVFAVKAQQNAEDSADKTVFLNATVTGEREFLKDLTAPDFAIYEGKKRQEITFFKREDEPSSVGVLFDLSASMRNARTGTSSISFAAGGFPALLAADNSENDYFFIGFGKETSILLEPTPDKKRVVEVLNNLAVFRPVDSVTKLYEALNLGLGKIERAKNRKKILILITDGMDNGSKSFDFGDVRKLLKNENVLLYAVNFFSEDTIEGVFGSSLFEMRMIPLGARVLQSFTSKLNNGFAPPLPGAFFDLETLTAETGGRVFYPTSREESAQAFAILAEELKSQYVLGFKPAAQAKKNEWRKIEVKVNLPKERRARTGKIFVRARTGFYF